MSSQRAGCRSGDREQKPGPSAEEVRFDPIVRKRIG
jgi:hypothetical protein